MHYLQKAELNGYRTIRNLSVEFQPGINIIIGKNGVGKSNFLRFLATMLGRDDLEQTPQFTSQVSIVEEKNIWQLSQKKVISIADAGDKIPFEQTKISLSKNQEEIFKDKSIEESSQQSISFFQNNFITHGIPVKYPFVAEPFSFDVPSEDGAFPIINMKDATSNFVFRLKINLFFSILSTPEKTITTIAENIRSLLDELSTVIVEPIAKHTNIENVRFNQNFNVYYNQSTKIFSVSNLFLEFFVSGQWLNFDALSDGTKRLFYIITETCFYNLSLWSIDSNVIPSATILLEEPELGLHPHQLDKLMQFIRDYSNEKQFIITTHSPQVLDILEKEELNRIQIARLENGKTTIKPLTPEQIQKAKDYMEDLYLSDYWRFSDLEE